ncbi:hypothetical protein HMPREF1548_06800, partial [Clostridium sp. KLE 1755]
PFRPHPPPLSRLPLHYCKKEGRKIRDKRKEKEKGKIDVGQWRFTHFGILFPGQ